MKRLYTQPYWKERQQRLLRRSTRCDARKSRVSGYPHPRRSAPAGPPPIGIRPLVSHRLKAPEVLCLSDPDTVDQTLEFIEEFAHSLKHIPRSTIIDLIPTQRITPDALCLLWATLEHYAPRRTQGQHPRHGISIDDNSSVRSMIDATGFGRGIKGFVSTEKRTGVIHFHEHRDSATIISCQIASNLIKFAMEQTGRSKIDYQESYCRLLEAMSNTYEHAKEGVAPNEAATVPDSERERWWATIFCSEGTTYFTVLDYGVGIFESEGLRNARNFWQRMKDSLSGESNHSLLRRMLEGDSNVTRTEKKNRGLGMPSIKLAFDRELIHNPVIVANDAVAHLESNEYRRLPVPLPGTMIYWEVRP